METETERLILRRFIPIVDAERMFEIYSDAETMRFLGRGPSVVEDERDAQEQHISKYYNAVGYGLWAVVVKSDNTLIGRCGILRQEVEGEQLEELSYAIDRNYWGKGYATEAAKATVSLASSRYGLNRLIALILPENTRSVRVAEKCGFQLERVLEQYKIWQNVGVYSKELSASDE